MDQANSTIKVIKAADVKGIQILPPPSRLVIVVQGNIDGSAVSAKQMCDSAVAKHLLNSLRKVHLHFIYIPFRPVQSIHASEFQRYVHTRCF